METNSYCYTSDELRKRKTLNYMQVFSNVPLWKLFAFFFFGHPPHLQLSSFTVCLEQKYVLALCVIFVQLLKFWSCFGNLLLLKSNLKATVSCLIEINSSVLPSCWLESWRIVICLCSFASSALYMAFELSSSIVEAT